MASTPTAATPRTFGLKSTMAHQRERRGRILLHQRETDDVEILGAEVVIRDEHQAAVHETESKQYATKTKIQYRNRLKELIEWIEKEYPDYAAAGVRTLSEAERNDQRKFYHKCTKDLVYTGLRVNVIQAFLGQKKVKRNGKLCSSSTIKKFHQAISFGAKSVQERLPPSYFQYMMPFLKAFNNEVAKAKKDGRLDEHKAEAIPFGLYRQICALAINGGNMLVWVWSILQWNFMCRSISIDSLGFHNFTVGEDCLKGTFDYTKADQSGERVNAKHIYANPMDPIVCPLLSLGVWTALEQDSLAQHEKLFLRQKRQDGTASSRYCSQVGHLLKENVDVVRAFMRPEHVNVHGLRKGSGTYATSGTTLPPSVVSVANRGEWSMGKVLDVYWKFSEPGDAYLGRILVGLEPTTPLFATLPPHWKPSAPLLHHDIHTAMNLMYGKILDQWREGADVDPTGVLLLCLASIVYHRDWIREVMSKTTGHSFSGVTLFQQPELLEQLGTLVTVEPPESMPRPTGIPPHIQHMCKQQEVLETCRETLVLVQNLTGEMKRTFVDVLETRALESGTLTPTNLRDTLLSFQTTIVDTVQNTLANFASLEHRTHPSATENTNATTEDGFHLFHYNSDPPGHHGWHVQESFAFPTKVMRRAGWWLWLRGMPGNQWVDNNGTHKQAIRPFRHLEAKMLPSAAQKVWKLQWKPIFSFMEAGCDGDDPIPFDSENLSNEDVEKFFVRGTQYLHERVSYVFQKRNHPFFTIATWSTLVQRSSIEKFGTDTDIAKLPPPTARNRTRQAGLKRQRTERPATANRVARRNRSDPTAAQTQM